MHQAFHGSITPRLARRIRGVLFRCDALECFLLAADVGHHQTDFFLGGGAGIDDAADLTAAQHQNAVAQLKQHVEVLADVNDGGALHLLLGEEVIDGVGGVDVEDRAQRRRT